MRSAARNFGSNVSLLVWLNYFSVSRSFSCMRSNTDTHLTMLSVVYQLLPPCVVLCSLFYLRATGWTLFLEHRCATRLATLFL